MFHAMMHSSVLTQIKTSYRSHKYFEIEYRQSIMARMLHIETEDIYEAVELLESCGVLPPCAVEHPNIMAYLPEKFMFYITSNTLMRLSRVKSIICPGEQHYCGNRIRTFDARAVFIGPLPPIYRCPAMMARTQSISLEDLCDQLEKEAQDYPDPSIIH